MILERIICAIVEGVRHLRAKADTVLHGPMTDAERDAFLTLRAKTAPDATDWRLSITDLLKILALDSSLGARKELAVELGYAGKLDGSAAMNQWLHREVMKKVAEREIAP